ncbi:MAG TPA: hypothetical protein PKE57_10235 [Cellvibrionaceae bacterium]|nr:hypothetical protein [Cellvibrionaceae bacterium]HMW46796.1 hypothetical protein [Cellvibrionaceae bacterium]HMW70614.1 hypothetical protein [Cellvibrionaceae bacterium]HMY39710.1 hypothetical protein [Marinagarivorans sp.]HNG61493.1 hypothetical protein [Cellvibrionaceae bacterium]
MKKQFLTLALALTAATATSGALAATQYLALAVNRNSIDTNSNHFTISTDADTLEGIYGLEYNEFFAAEARLGLGINKGKRHLDGQEEALDLGEIKIGSMYALYAKPQFNSGAFKAFALLGYAGYNSEWSFRDEDYYASSNTAYKGISYGLGAGWSFGQHVINIEWHRTKSKDTTIDSTAVSCQFNF